ncbi:endonuclease [Thiomicrospira sp.]|uniref:endonuclease n=1 Tax=Thiomicrospira sp. TaxID=935 RepID=UPI002F93EEAC
MNLKQISYGIVLSILSGLSFASVIAAPESFDRAKIEAKQYVYHDRNHSGGEFYCGCDWEWVGRSGGRVDHASCDYQVRAQEVRAARTEWEHIVPISSVGQQRQCWQNGGRQNCQRTDPVFNLMEANLHNLTISVGEINADRSNFRFGVLPSTPYQHGQCDFKVDFQQRVAEPRDEVKGMAARVYFYFADYYGLQLSRQQQQLFMAWDKQFPVTDWERERDRRIATRMGHNNPFVTGEQTWHIGFKPSLSGLVSEIPASHPASPVKSASDALNLPVRGNRNSKIYHLPSCPSYSTISERNIVEFQFEDEAINAGYRKAKNCD